MKLTMLYKDENSGTNACPSVYLAEDGSLVVQGDQLDPTTRQELRNLLPGEDAVRIPADVIIRAIERYGDR
jgi:hypothetical protein